MKSCTAWLVASLALATAATGRAQTVEALVEEALKANPDVLAAEQVVEAARHRPAQATALPDPMISTVYTNEGWSPSLGEMPDSNLAVMASQELPPAGSRGLQGRIAERDVESAAQQLARVRRSLAASVRRAWASLAQARALLVLVEEQAETWKQIEEVARARYAVGQGAQQDVLRVQVELTRVGQLRLEQQADEQVRLAELNRLVGRASDRAVETSALDAAEGPAEPLDSALERLRAESPELTAARTAVDRARLSVDLAKARFRPTLSVQAAYMNRGGFEPMWQAGVGVSLPLRRGWRKAGVAEAEARVRAAEAQLRGVELELRLRTQERLVQVESARRLGALYAEGIVPQGQMAVEAAVASYQAGKVPFLTVLEALATLYGDRSTQVRLQAGHARALASLEEAGLQPTSDVVVAAAAGGMSGGMGAAFSGAPTGDAAIAGPQTPGAAMSAMGGR
jgi:cobalt-zinc-cadmium efflux system outer membrane protein